ncbi:hypothetical protein HT031_002573 [Scenedesmus sp. PABB004]|nr:hypothetical protein HT031_002573 [Scenedesmus sp. PABB004]
MGGAGGGVSVQLRTVTGVVHELTLDTPVHVRGRGGAGASSTKARSRLCRCPDSRALSERAARPPPPGAPQVAALYAAAARALALPEERFKLVLKGAAVTHTAAAAAARAAGEPPPAAAPAGGGGLLGARARPSPAVALSSGDVLLVVPQRKAPSERLQRAAAEAAGVELADDDDDAALRFTLRADAPAWERALARFLQARGAPPRVLPRRGASSPPPRRAPAYPNAAAPRAPPPPQQCAQERVRAPELLLVWLFHVGPGRLAAVACVLLAARLVYAADPGLSAAFLLVAMIAGIFLNLGTKAEGEASAYSVFNPGVRRLPGQLDADELDRQIRQGQM